VLPAAPPPAATGSSKAVIAAWVVSIIILIGMAGAAIAYRQPIMRSWPASARAYALLGYK
jgi:predicted benzoate:H+ symporter BenE